MTEQERRRSPRQPFNRPVLLQVDDVAIEVDGRDISLHGIAVQLDGSIDLGIGDLVMVELSPAVRILAMVAACGPHSLHIAFVEHATESVRATLTVIGEGPVAAGLDTPQRPVA